MKMKSRKIFMVICLLALFVGCGQKACAEDELTASGAWRYKMTVTVETPEGIKSGYAVREMSNVAALINLPDAGNPAKVKGEAVVVDLGKRGKLFALMKGYALGSNHAELVVYHYFGGGTYTEGIRYLANLKDKKATLEPAYYPMLVMFSDINDPKTVTPVLEMVQSEKHPFEFIVKADHISELFGKGVRIKDIAIETTDEPVTQGVEQVLSWLVNIKANIDGTFITDSADLSNELHVGDFKKK